MTDPRTHHPQATTMAAFVDGTLEPEQVATVAGHLRECAECRMVVAETARFEREEEAVEKVAPTSDRPTVWRWWMAAAAILGAIALLSPFLIPLLRKIGTRQASPIAQLIEAAPREHRTVESRLSGFPWARLQAPARGGTPPDPAALKLSGAAGEVLEQTRDQRVPDVRHAQGVALLLIGHAAEGIAALGEAAAGSADKRVWNDLAAARYSVSEDHPAELPLALAAADRALKLDPNFAEAAFNRALILERMGIAGAARKAWQRYLEIDPASDWSSEAREHLPRLDDRSAAFDPKLLGTLPADALVRRFPQEARTWGETPILAEWGDAMTAGDAERAAAKLSIVRSISHALAALSGERLLEDAVAAIDRSDAVGRTTLAEAHRVYRGARIDYAKANFSAAEESLRRAAALFRSGGSPLADVAAHYAAGAAFHQNRGGAAREELEAILSSLDPDRARALAAQIHWTLAVIANSAGDWGTGVRESDAAATTFRALGEASNAAAVDSVAAHALELMGDADLAWRRRVQAIAGLCGSGGPDRCISLLHDAATTLASIDRADAAASLIEVAIESGRSGNAAFLATTLTKRARVAVQTGDVDGARRALTDARETASRVPDQSVRETVETQIAVEEAGLNRAANPRASVAALDRAAAFLTSRQLRHLLPHVRLERARALRAAGDASTARAAYDSALQEIEAQQQAITNPELRLTFLDTARQVIEESIDLELARGRADEAFRIADRRHTGNTLLSVPAAHVRPAPAGTAVIEYVVLPAKIVMFCISPRGLSVETVSIARAELTALITAFGEKVRRRAAPEEIRAEGARLFALLIAPLQARLDGVAQLVVIPDRQLYTLPFAALWDGKNQRHLAETLETRIAATAFAATSSSSPSLRPALVIADPPTPRFPRLRRGAEEAEQIAARHGATLLAGNLATRRRFIDAARGSALIHYTGHADSDAGASYGALLLAADGDDSGVLGTTEIARLSLPRHPLVVLAACGTFRGDPIHVSGMSSLARAFLSAGARNVAGTLWEIDDDVAGPLFLGFHEHLLAGASPAGALRQAQLDMIRSTDPRLAHPATWSTVVVLGNN